MFWDDGNTFLMTSFCGERFLCDCKITTTGHASSDSAYIIVAASKIFWHYMLLRGI